MKGQITIEYMVLSLVVLALLAISITTLIQVQKSSVQAMDNVMFRKSALDLHSTIEEACALGAGNQRTVHLARSFELTLDRGSRKLFFKNGSTEMAVDLLCPLDVTAVNPLSGDVIVLNEDGDRIKVEKR
ncbi:MAG: class III signal peptide-containing protein [Candidatus Micrarchaeota archaeon]